MHHSSRSHTLGPLLAIGYLLAWVCLWSTTSSYWDLTAGLRFALPLLVPYRYWPWLLAADWGGSAITDLWFAGAPVSVYLLGDLPVMPTSMLGVALARRIGTRPLLSAPEHVVRVLGTALFVAILTTLVESALIIAMHSPAEPAALISALGGDLLGDYLGMLLLTPVLIFLVYARPRREEIRRMLSDVLIYLLPALAVLFLLVLQGSPLARFARTLALVLVLFFAFRHGWRGSAVSMLLVSAAMTLFTFLTQQLNMPAQAHLFTAVAGTATLMLGSAIDALRQSSQRLAVQNKRLEGANQRLDHLAGQLSEVARRNLQVEEEQRRYMAAELHDELGQNLTAIQTRVKLAQGRLHSAGLDDVVASINEIIAHMRTAVRRMLDTLRPTVLDEFGLARALEEGPIQSLLQSAGIDYQFDLHGDPHPLDEDTRTAIYRVAQEAATNTVKHAQATQVRVKLRIGRRGYWWMVLLDIRDNGIGLPSGSALRSGGRGLQSMRDRVTTLGGSFRIKPCALGIRLHVLLRVPAETPDTPVS